MNALALASIDTFIDQIHHMDAETLLRSLPAESVDCVVTSPPYYALRDYGTAEWMGGDKNCDHVANPRATKKFGNPEFNINRPSREETKTAGYYAPICEKCGAIRQDNQLGLEELHDCLAWAKGKKPCNRCYVCAMRKVFAGVYRVLKPQGTLWLNLGDSYAAARGGTHQPAETLAGGISGKTTSGENVNRSRHDGYNPARDANRLGLRHKSLIGIPWRVALALQADGFILRSDIIWSKPNPMPESVKDRPTKAHEYIFLLSKSERYFYSADAVRENATGESRNFNGSAGMKTGANGNRQDGGRANIGDFVLLRNKRTVWEIPTQPFPDAHFAVFPPTLIEPMIKAGCPDGGIVCDPFSGSGTTALETRRQGKHYIGCDLNAEYVEMARARLRNADPLQQTVVNVGEIKATQFSLFQEVQP